MQNHFKIFVKSIFTHVQSFIPLQIDFFLPCIRFIRFRLHIIVKAAYTNPYEDIALYSQDGKNKKPTALCEDNQKGCYFYIFSFDLCFYSCCELTAVSSYAILTLWLVVFFILLLTENIQSTYC